jgi:signal transduction histidine kinase
MKSLPDVATQARCLPARGLLVFRWLSLGWIVVLAATGSAGQYRPVVTWSAVAVLVAWTAWVSRHQNLGRVELAIDLALAAGLILVAGTVARPGGIDSGPSLATYYPIVAAAAWGLARGPAWGLIAGAVLSMALAASRPINGVSLLSSNGAPVAALGNAAIGYLLAGGVIGAFSRLVDRTAQAVEDAMGEALREQAQLSRLKERESLARQIHDSVLQALALVHKRGRELAESPSVSPAEVGELAELARQQELSLRSLILSAPTRSSPGQASLRDVLEPVVNAVSAPPVNLTVVGSILIRRREAEEISAAVREALANVVEHAGATRASVFAEQEDGSVTVSVRDDGRGFVYDERVLRAANKAGVLRSMKGRIEDLGGTIQIMSAPGKGTEIEFRVPFASSGQGGAAK